MRKVVTLLFAVITVSGCVTMGNLDKSNTKLNQNEGIIIIGVQPSYRVGMKLGDIEKDQFVYSPNLPVSANIIPDQSGYIVTKLNATSKNQRYGITQLLPSGFTGPRLGPCDGAATATFNIRGGEVTYLGEVDYGPIGVAPRAKYTKNIDKVSQYVKNNYPLLDGKVKTGSLMFTMVTNMPCNEGPITVPVYIK